MASPISIIVVVRDQRKLPYRQLFGH